MASNSDQGSNLNNGGDNDDSDEAASGNYGCEDIYMDEDNMELEYTDGGEDE